MTNTKQSWTRGRAKSVLLPCLITLLTGISALAFTGSRNALPRFAGPAQRRGALTRTERKVGDAFLDLSAVEPAVKSYVSIWTPLFLSAKESGLAPESVLHWGHAAAMGTVLLAMGGYGTFLGWTTRLGNGDVVYPLNLGYTSRDMHPLLMGAALFFFFLGGQGGLVLLATAGQPILTSAHSSTAVLGLTLMGAQAALGLTMGDSEFKRTVHAFLGTGVMVLLLVHLYFGLNLGSSF